MRTLDRLLDPSGQSLPVAFAQGLAVLAIGVCMAVTHYVRRGFKWPADLERKSQ